MANTYKGLIVDVYRASGQDCTNNGITSGHDRLTIVGTVDYLIESRSNPATWMLPGDCRVFSPTADAPAAWLVVGKHGARDRFVLPADPMGGPELGLHLVYGGNLVGSSDSRWAALADHQYGVRVHDRHEP